MSVEEKVKIIEKENHEWNKRSLALENNNALEDTGIQILQIRKLKVQHLINCYDPSLHAHVCSKQDHYFRFVEPDEIILNDIVRHKSNPQVSTAFVRAGPREELYFEPKTVRAAIVTCGGLCPGLNNVIRELVRSLTNLYEVDKIIGFVGGFEGIYRCEPKILNLEDVADIHHIGGSILNSDRGGFDAEKIYDRLKEFKINQFYIIGGDGTMRGANEINKYCLQRGEFPISISGIPKTIDNDVDIIDRSFGFNTAVTEALRAIEAAKIEARCIKNGIGIVKLMGRHAGFIALHATLASGDVDLCLLPESKIVLEGDHNIYTHLLQRMQVKGHCVVVVAEGAGEDILGSETEVDAGGNRKLPAIGYFLKLKISEYFKSVGIDANVKYIDPSYMIRSIAANSSDAIFCMILAQNAVHGAMSGLTGFCVGLVNNRTVYIPMASITEHSPRQVDVNGRTFDRMLASTGQPRPPPNIDNSLGVSAAVV